MNLYFVNSSFSSFADDDSSIINAIKSILLSNFSVREVYEPEEADAIIIQEKGSFKNFHYLNSLLEDQFISRFAHKIYTINFDDCATGIFKGLYTSIPKSRYNPMLYASVPYINYPNNLIYGPYDTTIPSFLATWRGNVKSNSIRKKIVNLSTYNDICIETTDSWLNHNLEEKQHYVQLILNGKFSLCPGGWAPTSFRIYESMALRRVPVIISDQFIPPKGPDWKSCALFFPERKIEKLRTFLLTNEERHKELGEKAYNEWKRYFSPKIVYQYYASSLMLLIQSSNNLSLEKEIERYHSLKLHWSNKWTILQRVINRIKKITV